jgi:Uma2 family endonuclease
MVTEVKIPPETPTEIPPKPDVSNLITEDDTPVDNFGSEKQQRFLTNILYDAQKDRIFLACANVGIYHNISEPAIVPDFFLSLDVQMPTNFWEKNHRCYLVWEFGKVPEVAIEIVSNKVGGELDHKLKIYQRMRVLYYIVYDPQQHLGEKVLRIFKLTGLNYEETTNTWLEGVNLGLTLWEGKFEGLNYTWLRWCDEAGNLLLTGDERAENAENELEKLKEKLRQQSINLD